MIENIQSLDLKLFLILNSLNTPSLNPIMVFFSSTLIWLPFIAYMLYLSYEQLDKKSFSLFLLFLLLALVASDVTSSYLLKNIFQRLRPCRIAEIKSLINSFGQKCGGKFGFVSSHAANSVCILVFSFTVHHFKTAKFHLLWLLPAVVCFSRIYLGVHYPGDILGGLLVGSLWGLTLGWFFRNRHLRGKST